jgi:hypothetical protein
VIPEVWLSLKQEKTMVYCPKQNNTLNMINSGE